MRAELKDDKLAQRNTAKQLSTPSFRKWGVAALSEWVLIAAAYALALKVDHILFWFIATVFIGSRQHALGVLGHDAAHFTAAPNRRLNDLAGEVMCFWPLLTGLHDFRAFHLAHHQNFNTDKDPEIIFKNGWSKKQWCLPKSRREIIALFLGDLIGFGIFEVAKAFYLLGKTRARSIIGPLTWWLVVGSCLWAANFEAIIISWTIALLTSFWGFFRLRTWTEHVGSDSSHIVYMNWWQKFFITPHCSWSHDEHHDYPYVPFWQRHHLRPGEKEAISFFDFLASFEKYPASEQKLEASPQPILNVRGIK